MPTSAPSESERGLLKKASVTAEDTPDDVSDWRLVESWVPLSERADFSADALLKEAHSQPEWKLSPLHIPDRETKGEFPSHPLEQIKWTFAKNKACNSHYVNVVKALKWWRRLNPTPKYPKGYPVEHLIGQNCPDGIQSVAKGVTLALENIVANYGWVVGNGKPILPDHGVPEHDVFKRVSVEDFAGFYALAAAAATIAREALDADTVRASALRWRELFGERFPEPPDDEDAGAGSGPGGRTTGGFVAASSAPRGGAPREVRVRRSPALDLRRGRRDIGRIRGAEILTDPRMGRGHECLDDLPAIDPRRPHDHRHVPRHQRLVRPRGRFCPFGRLKLAPSKVGGLARTFPHQDYNGSGRDDLPWRSGELCLNTAIFNVGRQAPDNEPFGVCGPSGRLRWHVHRALAWLEAAARGDLVCDGDHFEVPAFPGAARSDATVAFVEDAESFAAWGRVDQQSGLVELAPLAAESSILIPTKFLSSSGKPLVPVRWEGGLRRSPASERGVWLRLKRRTRAGAGGMAGARERGSNSARRSAG